METPNLTPGWSKLLVESGSSLSFLHGGAVSEEGDGVGVPVEIRGTPPPAPWVTAESVVLLETVIMPEVSCFNKWGDEVTRFPREPGGGKLGCGVVGGCC